jgi:hypothetical protein
MSRREDIRVPRQVGGKLADLPERRPLDDPDRRMQAALLALSDERDAAVRRQLLLEQRAFERGRLAGYSDGYTAAERDMAAAWRAMTYPIVHREAHRRATAARCLSAAEAGSRRDAAEHERAFVARAYSTRPDQRTVVQCATVLAYPPPAGKTAGAA